jgi:hypothetical protein
MHVGSEKYVQKKWKDIKHANVKAAGPHKMDEEVEQVDELMVQNYISGAKGKSAEVHKNMNAGNYTVKKMASGKEVGSSEHDDSASAHAAAKKHIGEDLDPYNPKDIGFDFKYGGQHKGRRAEVHRMPGGHYEVRKYKNPKFDLGTGDHVETTKHTDRVKAGIEAQKFANMKEEVELEEKALAKSKQTVLVSKKGSKTAGGVMRIKKSEYDPKKHDLAEGDIEERKMSDAEMKKREHIVKGMKKKLSDFRSRYGSRAKDVMYATATKQAMKEDLAQPLIGSMDPTKDKKKKKENEQTAPAVTPITLPNFNVDVNTGRNV